jgi:translocation and assembly module TamA
VAICLAACAQAIGTSAVAAATEPRAQVEGQLDADLKAAIVRAIGDSDRPVDSRFEARRRARGAAEDAISVLRSEGYYAYEVDFEVGEGDAPKAVVRIKPGPRFVLGPARIDWVGPPPDPASAAASSLALAFPSGAPGRAAEVVSAEGRAVAALQKLGYADARAEPRQVVVDHATRTISPDFKIAAGPVARLDGVRVTTKGRTGAAWVGALKPWKAGDAYKPDDVAELERRLLDTNVFESVTVALAPGDQLTPDGLRPVIVSLAERKKHTIEVGASYGTTEGFGGDVKWTRYNLLARADTFSVLARGGKLDTRLELDLTLPHWGEPKQTLALRTAVYRSETPAYDQEGGLVSATVTHRWGQDAIFGFAGTYFTWGGSLDASRTTEVKIGTLTTLGRDVISLAGLTEMSLDRSNDPLDPRRGWRLTARAEPTLETGGGITLPYLKVLGQVSGYLPFDAEGRTVLAGRLKVGSILNGTVADIPAPNRFYAGGGGSVRGFGYQEVGPRLPDNTPEGGLSLVETSIELRHRIGKDWGVVGFVDAGTVGKGNGPSFEDLAVGAGIGVRYNLGFGPLRVDVATPVTARHGEAPVQIYVSLGQAF